MGESFIQRELLTPRKLAFNVIWYSIHFSLFAYGWYSQVCPLYFIFVLPLNLSKETNARLAGLNTLGYSVWTSRGAGLVLAFDGGMILIPMFRNIIRVIRPKLAWLFPADENIWFHRQVAYQILFWAVVSASDDFTVQIIS